MAKKSYRRRAADAERPAGGDEPRPAAVDPNVALFVSRMKEEQDRERAEKRAARAERKAAEEHQRLIDAKEAAAAELKRLRQQGGAGAAKVAAADAVYREALAALILHETGEAPAWAPAPSPPDDAPATAGTEPSDPSEPPAEDAEPAAAGDET